MSTDAQVEAAAAIIMRRAGIDLGDDVLRAALAAAQVGGVDADRLRSALEPFAEIGQWLFASTEPDDAPVVRFNGLNGYDPVLTRGHFKEAHAALDCPTASRAEQERAMKP